MNKKWNEDDTRWLKANFGRMDLQSLSHALGFPLTEVEHRIKQLKLHSSDTNSARHKTPASLKEAVRELSAARKDYEKAIRLDPKDPRSHLRANALAGSFARKELATPADAEEAFRAFAATDASFSGARV